MLGSIETTTEKASNLPMMLTTYWTLIVSVDEK
jgi:hypothetical protein